MWDGPRTVLTTNDRSFVCIADKLVLIHLSMHVHAARTGTCRGVGGRAKELRLVEAKVDGEGVLARLQALAAEQPVVSVAMCEPCDACLHVRVEHLGGEGAWHGVA